MDEHSIAKAVIDALVAFGTVMVAVLAIWGEWFRSKLAPLKLVILLHNEQGQPTTLGQVRTMYYHLRVVNRRPWRAGRDCRVILKGMTKRGPDGIFHSIPLPVPVQFIWAPAEFAGPTVNLVKEQIVDFGRVREDEKRFAPLLYTTPSSFSGDVGPNEAIRFQIEVEAIDFSSERQVFEVAWDGVWSYEPSAMAQHLRIREVALKEASGR
jgi:hypothetical protein